MLQAKPVRITTTLRTADMMRQHLLGLLWFFDALVLLVGQQERYLGLKTVLPEARVYGYLSLKMSLKSVHTLATGGTVHCSEWTLQQFTTVKMA